MLKAGVAGAGVFGGYHARKYASLPGVQLAAVYDHHPAHAEALAAELGAKPFSDLEAFLDEVEAVTIASPADTHAAIARAALAAGRHCYVEKPLATSRAEAEDLVTTAKAKALVLASGHQERVAFRAMGLLATGERPIRIEAVRRGTPSERNRDVSCALDLMIHDLDLALWLGGDWQGVEAGGGFDEIEAEVYFARGLTASFEASRVAEARERTMTIVYPSGTVEIDFLASSFRNETPHRLNPDFAQTPEGGDPLGASVSAFLAAIRGEGQPVASGEEGAAALDLALAVDAGAAA